MEVTIGICTTRLAETDAAQLFAVAPPDCVIIKVCPAMVRLPVLVAPVVFADTEKVAGPLPMPLPVVIVAQLRAVDAVHAQLLAEAVTVAKPVPPVEVKDWLVGEMLYVQAKVSAPNFRTTMSALPLCACKDAPQAPSLIPATYTFPPMSTAMPLPKSLPAKP